MSHRHNSRQRKKLHLAEFREWGFGVEGELTAPLSETQRDGLVDAFLEDCIEKNDMVVGGGGGVPIPKGAMLTGPIDGGPLMGANEVPCATRDVP